MFVEALFDLFYQHRSGSQVYLSRRYFNVAHVRGKPGKPCVYVLTIPIPPLQPVHSKAVTKVMDTRAGLSTVRNSAHFEEFVKGFIDSIVM
jgi:hypothetical protein